MSCLLEFPDELPSTSMVLDLESVKGRYSKLARDYANFRPSYPAQLLSYVAAVSPRNHVVWDCGTGNGQLARSLVTHFDHVFASDCNVDQLVLARRHAKIHYVLAAAERFPIVQRSVDAITVAQALHWFDLDGFYSEVERVLRPGGMLAVWSYHLFQTDPEIDQITALLYHDVLGPYWSPSIKLVEGGYETLPFPFVEIAPPHFEMVVTWGLRQFLGFLASWSAVPTFLATKGYHPVSVIEHQLSEAWGCPEQERTSRSPIRLRIGFYNG